MQRSGFYVLSQKADSDIEEIFDYTEARYGVNQTVAYVLDFEMLFKQFSENPHIGRERNEIKKGLFSFPKGEHTVFYRILEDHVRILRVLHRRSDIPRYF